ncbi:hypothetical protein [Komagataeibacter phage phiKX1]|nr:hypothetical protein [Komagataeibacter phage phiKX1]BCZ76175.1 hypothetical protein [Komagataeibacter phage phiKX2]
MVDYKTRIEAGARAVEQRISANPCVSSLGIAIAVLNATDALEWCTDIKRAPGLRHTVLVKLKDGQVTMANNEFGPGEDGWVDIIGMQSDIAESDIVAWRFCPDYQPPENAG